MNKDPQEIDHAIKLSVDSFEDLSVYISSIR